MCILPFVIHVLKRRSLLLGVVLCYIVAVLIITLGFRSYDDETRIVLNPIKTHMLFLRSSMLAYQESGWVGMWNRIRWYYSVVLQSFALNIFLFMPLGYLIPLSFSKVDRWWKVLSLGFLFSLFIETVQLITRLGWFDASDLLHNTLGALIGYWIYCKWLREKTT